MARKFIPQWAINYFKHLPEAIIANIKYGFPSQKLKVIGVTGTDGKTTTVNMIYKLLKDAGENVSMISTINAVIAGKDYDTGFHVTSPSANEIQKYLKISAEAGDKFFVLEVTSHGLDQFRVWGVNFEIGVITNITHEHLDYHKTFKNYLKTKVKLIKLANFAVLNYHDKNLRDLASHISSGKVKTFGILSGAEVNPSVFPIKLKLTGEFNLLNALAAASVGKVLKIDDMTIKNALENFHSLEGRMEEVKNNREIKIVIDFAHTPNALKQALKTLRDETRGKLIAVFGAASERDSLKRPLMGEISARIADITILTDEDPRFEPSEKIINNIASGAYQVGAKDDINLFKISDRAKAIKFSLSMAKKGDTVAIFGKGHEKSINYYGVEKPWSDKRAVTGAL